MRLTNLQCQNAKPKSKPYKLGDGGGMYLEIMPNGSKYWRLKYRWLTKERRLALGVFPLISLAGARERREIARKLLASGVDPAAAKRQARQKAILNAENSFEAVTREWHSKQKDRWKPRTAVKVLGHLENDLFPYFGSQPIADIDAAELLIALQKIEANGKYHTAGKVRQYAGQVFQYGIATRRANRDPVADLKGAITTAKTEHFASLEIAEMPANPETRKLTDDLARKWTGTNDVQRLEP